MLPYTDMRISYVSWVTAYLLAAFVLYVGLFVLPSEAWAQEGIVPSGRDGDFGPDGFGSCELVATINNTIRFLVGITGILAVIAFLYAGFVMVASRGDAAIIQTAKNIFANVLIGFVILLSAFLVVNTIMSMLTGDTGGLVNWNQVECQYAREAGEVDEFALESSEEEFEVPDRFAEDPVNVFVSFDPTRYNYSSIPNAGGNVSITNDGNNTSISSNSSGPCTSDGLEPGMACYAKQRCGYRVAGATCGRAKTYDPVLQEAAARYRVPVERLRGIMIVESSANPSAQSPVGAIGLMQIMPGTARSSCGLSSSDLFDVQKNIDCGARYYATQFQRFGSHDLAAAAYNAGPGRNGNSRDCPGLLIWQCPFNSGGCCSNNKVTNMNCRLNTGFNETRAYVDKVNIASQCR